MHNPAWLLVAKTYIGVKEVVGPKHNPTIIAWAKRLGAKILGIAVADDETPWCGLFVAQCLDAVGLPTAPIAVRAKSWASYGANLRADRLAPGAILVFERPSGGHVGFYVGEDKAAYHVLGGNQNNAVNVTRIEKSRCIARRWPTGVAVIGAPVWFAASGQVSRNEA